MNKEHYELLNIPYFRQFADGSGVKVAVLDSEIMLEHPEFEDKNIHYKEFIPSDNPNYHGTAVSSIIAGNTLGVAPNVELIHLKMLSDTYGSGASWSKAFSYAMRQDVDLICMSIGTKDKMSPSMRQSIQNATDKGVLVSAPSGNEGRTLLRNPADNPNVVAVGGITLERKTSKTSNRSKEIEAFAPSEDIVVAHNEPEMLYTKRTGTSFANAIFVGQLALMLSYVRQHDKELNLKAFIQNYNQKHRIQRKVFDMKIVKEELDNSLYL